jgi:hypothetical protein
MKAIVRERERVESKGKLGVLLIENERVNYTLSLTLLVKSRRAYIGQHTHYFTIMTVSVPVYLPYIITNVIP